MKQEGKRLPHGSDNIHKQRTQQVVNNNNNSNGKTKQPTTLSNYFAALNLNDTTTPRICYTPYFENGYTAVDTPAYTPAIPPLPGPLRFRTSL